MPTHSLRGRRCRAAMLFVIAIGIVAARSGGAQAPTTATFTPGTREIFALDLKATPVGGFPSALKPTEPAKKNTTTVVMKDGIPMLKAVEPSEFRINLPEKLPEAFTLEFDITPKACCGPADLAFEGTPVINRGAASSHILWQTETLIVVGGGEYFQMPMPDSVQAVVPSTLTHIDVSFEGTTISLFTNGVLLFTVKNHRFIRGQVLRVSLGGQNDSTHAVYLSRLRVAAGGGPVVASGAQQPSGAGATNQPTGGLAVTRDLTPTTFTPTVTNSNAGPVVSWPVVAQANGYAVKRWKIDDAACCTNSSGTAFTATSPWQDAPLPMSGTYVYRVTANTPVGQVFGETQFGFRKPEVGITTTSPTSVDVVLASPTTTGTITPITATDTTTKTALGERVTTSRTDVGTGPAPTNLRFSGIPNMARLDWDPVPGAVGYTVDRAVAGSTMYTALVTDPKLTDNYLFSPPPDPTKTYTYRVLAFQADGKFGTATGDYKTPTLEPANFTATPIGGGQVRFDWDDIKAQYDLPFKLASTSFQLTDGRITYFLGGPGTGTGLQVVSTVTSGILGAERNTYTLSGVPAGTQTWTLTVSWDPGGVITPSSSWAKATATVPASDPAPRYRLIALGFKAVQQTKDIDDARDGHGDEVYFSAIVNRTRLTGLALPATKGANLTTVMSRSHGDEAVSVPYGRIKSGTASPTGGIKSGDLVPADLDLAAPTRTLQTLTFPLRIWEGELRDSDAVVVHPTLWEDDVNPLVHALWAKSIFDLAAAGYSATPPTKCLDCGDNYQPYGPKVLTIGEVIQSLTQPRSNSYRSEFVANVVKGELGPPGNRFFECNTWAVYGIRRPCETHGVDRPIGLLGKYGWPEAKALERVILLTRSGVETALAGKDYPAWAPGTFVLRLRDVLETSQPYAGGDLESTAIYELYLRLERVP